MSMEMSLERAFYKPSIQGAARAVKRERIFELSLPALVTGTDAAGNVFKEETEIFAISAQEATLYLEARLTIESKIIVSLDIPKTLILEKPLRLLLSGTVIFAGAERADSKKQLIALRLDKNYRLQPH